MAGVKLAGVKWEGLDSFLDELRVLTSDLVDESNAILLESATAAKSAVAAAYRSGKTGNLKNGLILHPARGTLLSGAELVQTAPHGYIYERGTRVRQNKAGANRGQMQSNPTFIPITAAYRRTAISAVTRLLQQHGATRVTGNAEEE